MKITKARMKQIIQEEITSEQASVRVSLLNELSLDDLPDELQTIEKEVLELYKKLVGWSKKTAVGVEDKEAKMTLMKIPIAIKIAAQNIAKVANSDNEALLNALGGEQEVDPNSLSEDDLEPTQKPSEAPEPNSGDEDIKARELAAGDTYKYTSKKGNDSVVKVEDPKNDAGAVVLQKVNPEKGCKPAGNKFAAEPKTFASAIDDEIENCEIVDSDDSDDSGDSTEQEAPAAAAPEKKAQQQRPDNGASRGKQVSPKAAKQRKAKQKQQKASRKRNRPGNRPDQISESLQTLVLQEIAEELLEREIAECELCSTCGDPSHDHAHDKKTGIRISIGNNEEEYEIDAASLT